MAPALTIEPSGRSLCAQVIGVQSLSELHPDLVLRITNSGDDHGATRSDDDGAANTLG
jgi:hypothetical protein